MSGGIAFSRGVVESVLAQSWLMQKRQPIVNIGPLRIDLSQHLTQFGGQRIELTPREFALLTCLARYLDHVVTFDQLLNEAWGYDANDGTPAQVRLYVARLRRKLQIDDHAPEFILTERGIGYRLHSEALERASGWPQHGLQIENGRHPIRSGEPDLLGNKGNHVSFML
jgi:two-component system KDP operon response regulator KdpE